MLAHLSDAIYFYQKFLLGFSSGFEIGGTKAAAICLNIPASYRSHSTCFVFVPPALAHVSERLKDSAEEYVEVEVEIDTEHTTKNDPAWKATLQSMKENQDSSDTDNENDYKNVARQAYSHLDDVNLIPGITSDDDRYSGGDHSDNDVHPETVRVEDFLNVVSQFSALHSGPLNTGSSLPTQETFGSSVDNVPIEAKGDEEDDTNIAAKDQGCANIVIGSDNTIHCIQQHYNYAKRGSNDLQFLCLYEYGAMINIVDHPNVKALKINEKNNATTKGNEGNDEQPLEDVDNERCRYYWWWW